MGSFKAPKAAAPSPPPAPPPPAEDLAAKSAEETRERARRGLGTVATSWRGLVGAGPTGGRKSLLGE